MWNRTLSQKLLAMMHADEEMRRQNLEDPKFWDSELDRRHTVQLKKIIAINGWPTITMVGLDASHAAWLIAQHSDHDRTFQENCLFTMKELPKHEVLQPDIALLEDRILTRKGLPQLYGTQFEDTGDKLRPFPIADPKNLDMRRKNMNLEPFEEYSKLILQTFSKATNLQ